MPKNSSNLSPISPSFVFFVPFVVQKMTPHRRRHPDRSGGNYLNRKIPPNPKKHIDTKPNPMYYRYQTLNAKYWILNLILNTVYWILLLTNKPNLNFYLTP